MWLNLNCVMTRENRKKIGGFPSQVVELMFVWRGAQGLSHHLVCNVGSIRSRNRGNNMPWSPEQDWSWLMNNFSPTFFWHMPEWHHTRGSKPKWWASTLKQWTCWGFSFWPPGLLQNCPRVGRAPSKGYFGLDGGQWTLLEINTHTKLQFLNKAQSSH